MAPVQDPVTRYARSGDVHIAARMAAAARPGDGLVSGTVRDLVVGSGLIFEDRGAHELRGVPGEWPLLALAPE